MTSTVFKNAQLVNEGKVFVSDLKIKAGKIEEIAADISVENTDTVIDASGCFLLPGMIDDQVHFREPGLTHKGSIATESRAAVAGGITSYMEMPNVNPATTTVSALEAKFEIARNNSMANYSFYLGATEANLDEIKKLDPNKHCGVKVFMGASTGDLLVEHPQALDDIFQNAPTLIVTHCESSPLIAENFSKIKAVKKTLDITDHPIIRDTAACYASSSYAVDLAKKFGTQLHVLHITTARELELFSPGQVEGKQITAEACVHHLWFSEKYYPEKGNLIKCNPAIKSVNDRKALFDALHSGRIDIIATDHAPHTWEEKQVAFEKAPAGLPLVEAALLSLLDHVANDKITLPQIVAKIAHNPAIRYKVSERGFLREGYHADLVLVDLTKSTLHTHENSRYHCRWTPFDGHRFSSKIVGTWVNGKQVYNGRYIIEQVNNAQRLVFNH